MIYVFFSNLFYRKTNNRKKTICVNIFSDPYNDLREDYGKGGYEKLASLKNTHPHLKVM